jgi:hypothetical protein
MGACPTKPVSLVPETISLTNEYSPKRNPVIIARSDQPWSSVMSAFLNLIYREYCKASLAEMRRESILTEEIA